MNIRWHDPQAGRGLARGVLGLVLATATYAAAAADLTLFVAGAAKSAVERLAPP